MELQAVRYAAMVSAMTFDQAVDAFTHYLDLIKGKNPESEKMVKEFIEALGPKGQKGDKKKPKHK